MIYLGESESGRVELLAILGNSSPAQNNLWRRENKFADLKVAFVFYDVTKLD